MTPDVVSPSRDRSAIEPTEIEITQAMIDAGRAALWDAGYLAADSSVSSSAAVYDAIVAALNCKGITCKFNEGGS